MPRNIITEVRARSSGLVSVELAWGQRSSERAWVYFRPGKITGRKSNTRPGRPDDWPAEHLIPADILAAAQTARDGG